MNRCQGFPFFGLSNPPFDADLALQHQECGFRYRLKPAALCSLPQPRTPIPGLEHDSRYSEKILLRMEQGGY
jgi:hypothetical protein